MPTLANRMNSFQPSATAEITNKVNALKAAGEEVISFSIGVPNFQPPAHIYAAIQKELEVDAGMKYQASKGSDALLKAFSNRLQQDGFPHTPNEVVACAGGKHGLFQLFLMLLNEGDEVVFPAPYWVSYTGMVGMLGAKPVAIPCSAAQNYKLTAAQLESAITPRTKIFLFNNPNNPTGMVYTQEEVAALAAVAAKHDVWIISDDIYDKMVYDGQKFHHLLHAEPGLKERTFIVNSISKTYGLPGWRVGCIAGPKAQVDKLGKINGQTIMNLPPVAMAAATACFGGSHDFLTPIKADFEKKRDEVMATMDSLNGVVCPRPSGAFYAFPDVSALFGKSHNGRVIENDVDFCDALLTEKKVALVPGSAFGAPEAVRISYACKPEDLTEGLHRFAEFVKELN